MRRRDFLKAVAGSATVWPLVGRAQQGQRMRRIGVLMNLAATAMSENDHGHLPETRLASNSDNRIRCDSQPSGIPVGPALHHKIYRP